MQYQTPLKLIVNLLVHLPFAPSLRSSVSPVQYHRLALTFASLIGWIWLLEKRSLDGEEMLSLHIKRNMCGHRERDLNGLE